MRNRLSQAPPWPIALVCVAAGYSVAQLALALNLGLGSDEALYLSQFAHGVPAEPFGAPRAWGLPLLTAPVAAFTASVTAIRVYLSLLSGVGMLIAYWPWLRLWRSGVVPLAAFLFACIWIAIYYGDQAMPNLYVAFGAVAAVGLFSLSVVRGSRAALFGLFASVALLSLVRPSDSLWIAAPLVLATLSVRRWRKVAPVIAIGAGLAVGWGQWIVEAYLRFGGPIHRLHEASAANDVGLHFTLGSNLRVLDAPFPCFPQHHCGPYPVSGTIWFVALPVLAAVGLIAARGGPRLGPLALSTAAAIAIGGSYVLLVGYAAPRFLLPYYALLLIPVAEGLSWLVRGPHRSLRPLTAALAAAGVAAFLLVQFHTLDKALGTKKQARGDYARVAAALEKRAGIRPPCFVSGDSAPQVAYTARCTAGLGNGGFGGLEPPPLAAAQKAGERVAVVVRRRPVVPASSFLQHWTRMRLSDAKTATAWYAFVPR